MKKITKKLTLTLWAVFAMALPLLTTTSVFADSARVQTGGCVETDADFSQERGFLGIKPWYNGLADSKGNIITPKDTQLPCFVWTAVSNVTSSVLGVAAVLAIGFVIYGGYMYIFSGGDVGKTTKGRKTLYTSFIGLAVIVCANIIFSTIRIVLYGNGVSNSNGLVQRNVGALVNDLVQWFVGIAGVISAIFLVYGAISYITSAGDAGKLAKAKNCIMYALIGLAIVGAAEVIVSFYMGTINSGAENAALNNLTTIAKGGL